MLAVILTLEFMVLAILSILLTYFAVLTVVRFRKVISVGVGIIPLLWVMFRLIFNPLYFRQVLKMESFKSLISIIGHCQLHRSSFTIFTIITIYSLFLYPFIIVLLAKYCNNRRGILILIFTFMGMLTCYCLLPVCGPTLVLTSYYTFILFLYILWYKGIRVKRSLLKNLRSIAKFILVLYMPLLLIVFIGGLYDIYFLMNRLNILESHEIMNCMTQILRYSTIWSYRGFTLAFRSSCYWDWLLFGFGACGETAEVGRIILTRGGLEAFVAGFPAEDHVFTIVSLNGTWYVIDPGYYTHAVPLSDRIVDRIRELGNVSYIVIYLDTENFLELTQYYVPYDTIIIKVTYQGLPVVGTRIRLVHKFKGTEMWIPGGKYYFHTNSEGIVVVHLGSPKYKSEKVSHYEPYFLIYVNDKRTHYKVTSTGSYRTWYVHIELTELNKNTKILNSTKIPPFNPRPAPPQVLHIPREEE